MFGQGFEQLEALGSGLGSDEVGDFGIVEGVFDLVAAACWGKIELQIEVENEGLGAGAFPIVNADEAFGFEAVEEDGVGHGGFVWL